MSASSAPRPRPEIASLDEDPNATLLCSSPPCFLHELDPTYLGYLGPSEVRALLNACMSTTWPQLTEEAATQQSMLQDHLTRYSVHSSGKASYNTQRLVESSCYSPGPEQLARRLHEALPRIHDDALRHDLGLLLERIEHPPCWDEVRIWRKKQREALIAKRLSISRDDRARCKDSIHERLSGLMPALGRRPIVGMYWPFKGEFDPRSLMRSLHQKGARLALPVVNERRKPVTFREWWPGIRMTPGIWDIPVPAEGEAVLPNVLVVPLVGFDVRGYRLGYGGGYYDRTLAAMPEKPLTIGVGFEMAKLHTIYPQSHDVPMDLIVTEHDIYRHDSGNKAAGSACGVETSARRDGEVHQNGGQRP